MSLSLEHAGRRNLGIAPGDEHDLVTRIQAEFREMPGLMLTLPQAARLFNIEPRRCERILGALVDGGHLSTNGQAFVSPDLGRRSA